MINFMHFTPSQAASKPPSGQQLPTQTSFAENQAKTGAQNNEQQTKVNLSDEARALDKTKASAEVGLTAAQQRSQGSADVIVGFINQHLDRLKADGATEQELAQALSDGFEGFRQGFTEAMQILGDSGLLNDELTAELNDTQARVGAGLEQLRQQYSPSSDLTFEGEDQASGSTTVVTGYQSASYSSQFSIAQNNANSNSIQSQFAAFAQSYQQQQLANLEVLTRDGDKISIRYEASESYSRTGGYSESNQAGITDVAGVYSAQSESGFGFAVSVEGELDEGEIEALDKLFAQVDDLAQQFFEGDFDRAFAMAMELQIDTSELASMSLDMQQTTSYSATQAYGSVQQLDNPGATESRPAGLSELGNFVQGIIDALETADMFEQPIKLLSDLFANRLAQQSLLFPENNYAEKAQQLDALMPQSPQDIDV